MFSIPHDIMLDLSFCWGSQDSKNSGGVKFCTGEMGFKEIQGIHDLKRVREI